jgi:hypothetical protein
MISSGDTIESEAPARAGSDLRKARDIAWSDIESMLLHNGAEISEGRGPRVRIALNGVRAVFHRPHPQKETDRGAVASMQRFLTEAGIGIGGKS